MGVHGDLVCAIVYLPIVAVHVWKAAAMLDDDPKRQLAFAVTSAFFITGVVSFLAWWRNSLSLSNLALFLNVGALCLMNLSRWPFENECAIVPQLCGILIMRNVYFTISTQVKVVQTLFIFCAGFAVVSVSPLVELEDALPLLSLATVADLSILFLVHTSMENIHPDRLARQILIFMLISDVVLEIRNALSTTTSATEGSFAITKAAFFAAVGLAAAGFFRREIDLKESLEVLVEERTKELQKQAQELQMVELALQSSETAIAITDSTMSVMWWNPALSRLSKTETLQRRHSLVEVLDLSSADAQKLEHSFDRTGSTELQDLSIGDSIVSVEVSPLPHKGFQFPNKSPKLSPETGNKECYFIVVLKDITADRAREKAEQAARRKKLLNEAMSESIAVVSHEMRTPLQGIMGIASMLLQDASLEDQTEVTESVSLIMASSSLLLTLVNNMLDVRKCEANMMAEFQLTPITSLTPMKDAIDFCRPLAAISGIELKISEIDRGVVNSDALRLQQVFINLISNAIKYTSKESKILIESKIQTRCDVDRLMEKALVRGQDRSASQGSRADEKVMVFSVSDEGEGINPGQEKKVFQKFSQLDSKQQSNIGGNAIGQPSGTGLGLNLCLKFVTRMGGNIWVVNNISQKGSTFSFYIPLALENGVEIPDPPTTNGEKEDRSQSPSAPRPLLSVSSSAAKYRVLLVDDTLLNRKVFERMLQRIGVATIVTVDSGRAGLRMLETGDFNLVLSDLQMPEMSGTEFSEKIYRNDRIPKKPVVVGLTASTGTDVVGRCVASGMADVIHKPVTVVEMHDYFEHVIDGLTPVIPSIRRGAGCCLNAKN